MNPRASSVAARALFSSDATRALSHLGETELRLLRTFVVVADAGGFSAAAAELQVDLSTISRQVRELESWLGPQLAQRGRGGFCLTPEGARLQAMARRLFAALSAFGEDAATLGQRMPPVLRLGVVDALLGSPAADRGLPAVLRRCVDAVPGLHFQLVALRPLEIERSILSGSLDAGVIAARAPASGLEQHLLYREPNSLYVAPGHPWYDDAERERDDDELAQAFVVSDPYCHDLPEAVLERIGRARLHTRADSMEGVALLVSTGRFAGFLPDHMVQGTMALKALRPLQPARLSYCQDIVLTCRLGNADSTLRMLLRQVVATPSTVAAAPGCPPAWSGSTPR